MTTPVPDVRSGIHPSIRAGRADSSGRCLRVQRSTADGPADARAESCAHSLQPDSDPDGITAGIGDHGSLLCGR
jgi:hypothetical protein